MAINVGDRVRLKGVFANLDGAAANPTTVTVKVRKPSGTVTSYTGGSLTNPTPGEWRCEVDCDIAGSWAFRFEGVGALVAAEESVFDVRTTGF